MEDKLKFSTVLNLVKLTNQFIAVRKSQDMTVDAERAFELVCDSLGIEIWVGRK